MFLVSLSAGRRKDLPCNEYKWPFGNAATRSLFAKYLFHVHKCEGFTHCHWDLLLEWSDQIHANLVDLTEQTNHEVVVEKLYYESRVVGS